MSLNSDTPAFVLPWFEGPYGHHIRNLRERLEEGPGYIHIVGGFQSGKTLLAHVTTTDTSWDLFEYSAKEVAAVRRNRGSVAADSWKVEIAKAFCRRYRRRDPTAADLLEHLLEAAPEHGTQSLDRETQIHGYETEPPEVAANSAVIQINQVIIKGLIALHRQGNYIWSIWLGDGDTERAQAVNQLFSAIQDHNSLQAPRLIIEWWPSSFTEHAGTLLRHKRHNRATRPGAENENSAAQDGAATVYITPIDNRQSRVPSAEDVRTLYSKFIEYLRENLEWKLSDEQATILNGEIYKWAGTHLGLNITVLKAVLKHSTVNELISAVRTNKLYDEISASLMTALGDSRRIVDCQQFLLESSQATVAWESFTKDNESHAATLLTLHKQLRRSGLTYTGEDEVENVVKFLSFGQTHHTTEENKMDPESISLVLSNLAIWIGVPFFTSASSAAGEKVGKYFGSEVAETLKRVFGHRIQNEQDLRQEQLERIAIKFLKEQQPEGQLEQELLDGMKKVLQDVTHFSSQDLLDVYYVLGIDKVYGPPHGDPYSALPTLYTKAGWLVDWAYSRKKMHLILKWLQETRKELFCD